MPPGRRGRARGAPARGCISITRPAVTGGSEPQRGGGGEGHYLWGGGLPGPQGYRDRMGRAAGASGAWGLRSAAGCGKPHAQGARTRARAYHPGVRALVYSSSIFLYSQTRFTRLAGNTSLLISATWEIEKQ